MGSAMSTSKTEKAVIPVGTLMEVQTKKGKKENSLKCISSWRQMMKKRSNKVQPNDNLADSHVNNDQSTALLHRSNNTKSTVEQAPVTNSTEAPDTPQTVIDQASDTHKRPQMIQAKTGELLWCLGDFLCQRCPLIQNLSPMDLVTWLRIVDQYLLEFQYQSQSCIHPSSVVFLYMLCRVAVFPEVATLHELHAVVLTCMYITCSYMASETRYPLRPFLVETSEEAFWMRYVSISKVLSGEMHQINTNPSFFSVVLADLKNQHQEEDLVTVYRSQ